MMAPKSKAEWRAESRSLTPKAILIALAIAGLGTFWAALPRIEGRVAPVVSPAALVSHAPFPPPDYRTIWTATAHKLRDCPRFKGIEWFYGQRQGGFVGVEAFFLDAPEIRDIGTLEWDALVISMAPQDTLSFSFADVLHRCPLFRIGNWTVHRPWLTRSPFFDPPPL